MSQVYCASEQFKSKAHISSTEAYRQLYEESIANPSAFWSNIATQFYWRKTKSTQLTSNFDISKGSISTKFFEGSETNICYNLVDRHVEAGHGDRVAYLWEGNQPDHCKTCTYSELSHRVNKLANGLKELGVRKGDRVALYMPTTIELVSAMLACARIGAVHSVIFAGFSSEALADRMIEGRCRTVLTANGTFRGEKFIPLKALVTRALAICKSATFKWTIVLSTVTCVNKIRQLFNQ
ncbi:Acetyl-coenzyme A synthetase [Halotydeus destructor]|nr:Acetyl-coenzyme A synthetase [Halotydeus destructor]